MGGEHVCTYVWVGGDSGRTNTACYVGCHAASVIREGEKVYLVFILVIIAENVIFSCHAAVLNITIMYLFYSVILSLLKVCCNCPHISSYRHSLEGKAPLPAIDSLSQRLIPIPVLLGFLFSYQNPGHVPC